MSNKVIICGYGWLGGYLANALETRSLIATTRDEKNTDLTAPQIATNDSTYRTRAATKPGVRAQTSSAFN